MLKKIAAAALSVLMALQCGTVMAEEIAQEETAQEETAAEESAEEGRVSLSLDEAIASALDKNPQIEAADAKIKSAELTLEVTNMTQKDFDKLNKAHTVAVDVSNSMDTAYLKHGYYPVAAQTAIDLAKLEKEKIEASIAYDVTEKYFNLKLLEKLLDIAEASYELTKDNADIVQKQFELGYVSNLEVKNAEAAVESAQFSIEGYKRNILLATDSLKIAIQQEEVSLPYELTDDIIIPEMPENLDEAVSAAMETRYDVTALKKALDLQSMYFDITALYVNDKTAKYHEAYSDYVSAKYTYENSAKMIALSIRSEYMDILSAKESILTAENALAVKQIEYDSGKIKYEMGVITNIELTEIMTELEGCKVQLENANLSYMLAAEKYNYDIGIGI